MAGFFLCAHGMHQLMRLSVPSMWIHTYGISISTYWHELAPSKHVLQQHPCGNSKVIPAMCSHLLVPYSAYDTTPHPITRIADPGTQQQHPGMQPPGFTGGRAHTRSWLPGEVEGQRIDGCIDREAGQRA
ncbi:hypothetical protein VOLCADRAFT_95746 [Volvox carteri f. nagariensis]|uniref:Uncharacterized protein n=1 Tax=Volvox carteri f. nagariensis TaxID=3068 RepID=D8U8A0_VOLCA|nr:uncharacterized protein VOLCADRAFT_95746 [Volvox carteri f. nagariensis]EFJ44052.1 hypothetical protein VOLCADRAFT_95746 [Volvox carteri f. nagariensis]|eukprot:XP_002954853.1 hypothetical protein VOLCADRAFT_95746 [Volvox carteri f. nagariensis]